MHRTIVIAFAAAVLAVVPPALTRAHSATNGFAYGDDDDFNWAIISGDDQSMSGQLDMPTIESLKERFGDEFLLVGDHGRRFVITDEAMVERAQDAARDLQKYGREIGEIARAQVRLSLGDAGRGRDERIRQLEKRRAELHRELQDRDRRDESTDGLEEELFQVRVELKALKSVQRSFELTSDERGDFTKRKEEASERLRRGVRRINEEMRAILEEARERRLAQPVD